MRLPIMEQTERRCKVCSGALKDEPERKINVQLVYSFLVKVTGCNFGLILKLFQIDAL